MHELYEGLNARLAALMDPGAPLVSNLANAAALLYEELPRVNWAGFYLARGEELLLGPFGGKPACLRIPFGKGVCGTAAARRETILVPDVHAFPGHIACDSASRSEIVLPLIKNGRLFGVLDIDSPERGRFSEEDAAGFTETARILASLPGWEGGRLL
ncbi:MAG TPA: GAF domain-containing protein [Candidatus Merdivicinus faecavium]|nr:GAF domain-containing protein [Candidatus Merdivicinus faecavium]